MLIHVHRRELWFIILDGRGIFFSSMVLDTYDPNRGNWEKVFPKVECEARVPTINEH